MTRYRNFFHAMSSGLRLRGLLALSAAPGCSTALHAQTMKAPDITRDPTLYVVPYAHLDTQWRWEMPQTISEYLLKTMRVNFDYIDKYPHYVFNWTGSNRYRLMKEYFPDDYARLTQYVARAAGFRPARRLRKGMSICPAPKEFFARSFTATITTARILARRARSSCCRTALDSPPLCPASSLTPA
jgi:alpha-mannosidase